MYQYVSKKIVNFLLCFIFFVGVHDLLRNILFGINSEYPMIDNYIPQVVISAFVMIAGIDVNVNFKGRSQN